MACHAFIICLPAHACMYATAHFCFKDTCAVCMSAYGMPATLTIPGEMAVTLYTADDTST
jgi:hypothetical protein